MGILRERERMSPGPACHSWKCPMTLGLSPRLSVNCKKWTLKEIKRLHWWAVCWTAGWAAADLFEEPGDEAAQDERVVGLSVVVGQADVAGLPQIPLPAVQVPGCWADVKQDHVGAALDQPAAKMNLQHQHQRKKPTASFTVWRLHVENLPPEFQCVKTCILDLWCKNQLDFASNICSFKILLWELNPINHSCGCSHIKH